MWKELFEYFNFVVADVAAISVQSVTNRPCRQKDSRRTDRWPAGNLSNVGLYITNLYLFSAKRRSPERWLSVQHYEEHLKQKQNIITILCTDLQRYSIHWPLEVPECSLVQPEEVLDLSAYSAAAMICPSVITTKHWIISVILMLCVIMAPRASSDKNRAMWSQPALNSLKRATELINSVNRLTLLLSLLRRLNRYIFRQWFV
jgi:hypothetical protein